MKGSERSLSSVSDFRHFLGLFGIFVVNNKLGFFSSLSSCTFNHFLGKTISVVKTRSVLSSCFFFGGGGPFWWF